VSALSTLWISSLARARMQEGIPAGEAIVSLRPSGL
jgi:hypothetical protein